MDAVTNPSARRPALTRVAGPVAALACGMLVALGFAPTNLWPLTIIGVALFTWLVRAGDPGRPLRRGAWWGYLMGLGLFTVLVGWISVLGWYVGVALVAYLATWGLLVGLVTAATRSLPGWPLLVAAGWSLMEFCSSRFPFGGFGWMRLGFTTPDMALSGYLPWIGVAGVSYLVALFGALIAWAMERMLRVEGLGPRLRQGLVPAALIVALAGLGPVAGLRGPVAATAESVAVGMVQGNVDGTAGSQAMGYARSVTNNHLSETIMLMAKARVGSTPMPDFVLWPENSTDVDPTKDAQTRDLLGEASRFAERPIFVGAVMAGPGAGERQTSGLWWTDAGVAARYDKRNLVPFGEFIPFRDVLLPMLPVLEQVGKQSVPGTEPGVLQVPLGQGKALRIGDVICFELAWDATVYDTARHRQQLLVVQSNNATYTATGQPRQQFQITRVRAMELRREVVVSTTSSFSGHVGPRGEVLAKTQESTSASATYLVPLREGTTPAITVGPWWERVAALVGILTLVVGVVRARRRGQPLSAGGE